MLDPQQRQRIENIVTTGTLEGKRGRGRPAEKILDGLTKWHGRKTTTELIESMKDRDLWGDMAANPYQI